MRDRIDTKWKEERYIKAGGLLLLLQIITIVIIGVLYKVFDKRKRKKEEEEEEGEGTKKGTDREGKEGEYLCARVFCFTPHELSSPVSDRDDKKQNVGLLRIGSHILPRPIEMNQAGLVPLSF